MATSRASAGIHEFVFGGLRAEREETLRFWGQLGFRASDEGGLSAKDAAKAYGHESGLESVRLRHPGCDTFETGLVRLQFWERLANEGLAAAPPIVPGSRWMGLYTHDILQLRDSFESPAARRDWVLWLSPLVNAPLAKPAPEHDYYTPFTGLRETLVFARRFRLAFIQRAGFDRPGFGTFDDGLPFKNTEGSHANIVQPDNAFSSAFYKRAFGFETAPFGEAHDSGDEAPTIAALNLREGETFHVERTRAPECPSGLLQIYSSYLPADDFRHLSRPGCGNLCAYSVRVGSVDGLARLIDTEEGAQRLGVCRNEFGETSLCFDAPDGYAWLAVDDVA